MKIYEVFVCVPYYDPDYNVCYERHNGTFFTNKSDAEAYINKMFNDKKANDELESEYEDEVKRRYVTLSDYTETEISWEEFCVWCVQQEMSEEKRTHLREVFETNRLVHSMKWRDAILLAVTYGSNRWYLREAELN